MDTRTPVVENQVATSFDYTSAHSRLLYTRHLVASPRLARTFGFVVMSLFTVITLLLIFLPWVQTVTGEGHVTSLYPSERPQYVEAQISGRLVGWKVVEGERVSVGDTIAILQDIDVKFLDTNIVHNTLRQVEALEERSKSSLSQIDAFRRQILAEETARDAGIDGARGALKQAIQRRIALEAQAKQEVFALEISKQRYNDRKDLFEKGLRSTRDFERAKLDLQEAQVKLDRINADVTASKNAEEQAHANILAKESEGNAKILKAIADESKALETFASIGNSMAKTQSELSGVSTRRSAGVVRAPSSGRVVRLYSFGTGETVKQGEPLAIVAPESRSSAVEIFVSGNDAPLVHKGAKVRVQFDGFPAFQVSGFPGATVGTFGGEVVVVDAVDDDRAKGMFRVLVKPDTTNDPAWPNFALLRLGTKARAWCQLGRVSLGWELWRQFNGFPPNYQKPREANPLSKAKVDEKKSDDQKQWDEAEEK